MQFIAMSAKQLANMVQVCQKSGFNSNLCQRVRHLFPKVDCNMLMKNKIRGDWGTVLKSAYLEAGCKCSR